MDEIIKLTNTQIGNEIIQTINARELHDFLGSKQEFAAWIKNRILQYDFVEGQDFTIDKIIIRKATQIDYHITLDMAKELAMVERNEKGKQARAYFIACEKRAKQGKDPLAVLNDPNAMRGLLLNYSEKVIALESRVNELKPQAEALARIAKSDGSLCITDAAKSLQINPRELFQIMRGRGWIYKRLGMMHDVAYQDKIQSGFLEHKITTVSRGDGSEKAATQVRVTPKGMAKLANIISEKLRLVS